MQWICMLMAGVNIHAKLSHLLLWYHYRLQLCGAATKQLLLQLLLLLLLLLVPLFLAHVHVHVRALLNRLTALLYTAAAPVEARSPTSQRTS